MSVDPASDKSSVDNGHDPYVAWRHGNFRLYICGFFFAGIAAQLASLAVEWEIYLRTESALALGYIGLVLALPVICLALPAGGPRSSLAPALELVSRAVRKHAIVFVVSDFLSGGWEQALDLCARRHDVIAVRLLTPELALPAAGLTRRIDRRPSATCTATLRHTEPISRSRFLSPASRV